MRRLTFFIAVCWYAVGLGLAQDVPRKDFPVKATITSKANDDGRKVSIRIALKIDAGWYVLANPTGNVDLVFDELEVKVRGREKFDKLDVKYPKGETVKERVIGEYNIYRDTVVVEVDVTRMAKDTGPLEVEVFVRPFNNRLSVCIRPDVIKHRIP